MCHFLMCRNLAPLSHHWTLAILSNYTSANVRVSCEQFGSPSLSFLLLHPFSVSLLIDCHLCFPSVSGVGV